MSRRLVALHLQRVLLDQIVDALVDEHRIIQRHHLGLPGSVEPYPGHDTLGKREWGMGNCERRNSVGARGATGAPARGTPSHRYFSEVTSPARAWGSRAASGRRAPEVFLPRRRRQP